jgi:hypothetical protein
MSLHGPQDWVVGFDGSTASETALLSAITRTRSASFAMIHVVTIAREDERGVEMPSGVRMSRFAALESLRLTVRAIAETSPLLSPRQRVLAHLRLGGGPSGLVDFAHRFHTEQILLGPTGIGRSTASVGRFALSVLEASGSLRVHLETPTLSARRSYEGEREVLSESVLSPRFVGPLGSARVPTVS